MSNYVFNVIGACLCVLLLGKAAPADEKPAQPPHIVILMADDLGWGDVGYHDSQIKTPNIDKLAAAGTRLERFYVMPVCSPTRGALLTGRYPIRLGLQCGVVRPWAMHGLPVEERTLADGLHEAGYETALVGKWHLGHNDPAFLPTRRGFDHQYGHYKGALDYFTHIRDGGLDWHRDDKRCDDEGYTTNLIGKEATRIIAAHDKAKPLFLYVPFNAPHGPIQAPQEYIDRYAEIKDQQRRIYAGMVTCMDDAIGRIVDQLETSGFPRDNTLILFLSDNGGIPRFGSVGDFRGSKGTLYEGGVRSPTVMVWPSRVKAGAVVEEPLHVVDIYPTLLGIAGVSLEQEHPLDGRDAWPTITQGAPSPHDNILLNATPFGGAVMRGSWKLVINGQVASNDITGPKQQRLELFDLASDPSERDNKYNSQPKIASELQQVLAKFTEQAVAPHLLPNSQPADFHVPEVWGESH